MLAIQLLGNRDKYAKSPNKELLKCEKAKEV